MIISPTLKVTTFKLCGIFLSQVARTPEVCSRNFWVSAIKKPNQMANKTLNFEAGNGKWWQPFNHERKLLIGPEHTLHWIHWRISCSFKRKYGWKTVDSYVICFDFLITHSGGNFGCPYCLKRCFKRSSDTVFFFPVDFKQRFPKMSFMVTLHEQVLLLMPITTTLKFFILCS